MVLAVDGERILASAEEIFFDLSSVLHATAQSAKWGIHVRSGSIREANS